MVYQRDFLGWDYPISGRSHLLYPIASGKLLHNYGKLMLIQLLPMLPVELPIFPLLHN